MWPGGLKRQEIKPEERNCHKIAQMAAPFVHLVHFGG
jgi:hypothetical protein